MNRRFERSETTAAVVRYLAAQEKGAQISYQEISDIVGTELVARSSHLVYGRKILERDHAAVWVCVAPGVGLYRLTDPEIAERQRTWFLLGARNKLSAGSRQADVVVLDQLDMTQQAKFATASIIREIAATALSRATQRRVEKVSRGTSNDLPVFSAVEWMISLSPRRSAAS